MGGGGGDQKLFFSRSSCLCAPAIIVLRVQKGIFVPRRASQEKGAADKPWARTCKGHKATMGSQKHAHPILRYLGTRKRAEGRSCASMRAGRSSRTPHSKRFI